MKKLLLEALLVALIGAGVGLAANALSPRGLKLSRNYFPSGATLVQTHSGAAPPATNAAAVGAGTDQVLMRLRSKGLEIVESAQAEALFTDPRYQQELIVFIDARDDQHYQAGHVPGAYQLDYYRPENYLPSVLGACQMAQQIVVYCGGGECEDSELAAILLRDTLGLTKEKLFVYAGGIKDWEAKGRPLELGPRKSGQLRNSK